MYGEIYSENKFLKQRINDLENSYNTINDELKRMKDKYKITSIKQFMDLYGSIADRMHDKIIRDKYYNETGIKYSLDKIDLELELLGYQIKHINKNGIHSYATLKFAGYLNIVQLKKHNNTNIYKVGMTINMNNRLALYERTDGGANEIVYKPVINQFDGETKLLKLLNDAVMRNELKKYECGNEYFEGSLEVIKKYYNQVVEEFKP